MLDQENANGDLRPGGSSSGVLNSMNSHSTKCTSEDDSSTSINSGSGPLGTNHTTHNSNSPLRIKSIRSAAALAALNNNDSSVTPTTSHPAHEFYNISQYDQLCHKLDERTKDVARIQDELEQIKTQCHNDLNVINLNMQDEKYRVEVNLN